MYVCTYSHISLYIFVVYKHTYVYIISINIYICKLDYVKRKIYQNNLFLLFFFFSFSFSQVT